MLQLYKRTYAKQTSKDFCCCYYSSTNYFTNITMHILLSRTDSIGDVVLTLPMAGVLKEALPDAKVSFLGRTYTRPVVERCTHVDTFYDWDTLNHQPLDTDTIVHVFPRKEISRWAKRSSIATRIGTSHRLYHWTTCNRLVNLGRKKSPLHEAQLNLALLNPLLQQPILSLKQLPDYYGWRHSSVARENYAQFLSKQKFNLIIHPKSQGSAIEWPLSHYLQLIQQLPPDQFQLIVTGTAAEGDIIQKTCPDLFQPDHVMNATGAFSLSDFIDFIARADGLLACSTGPLHLAAASGIRSLGLYSSVRPIHAGRWGPVGKMAEHLSSPDGSLSTPDLGGITPQQVIKKLLTWID